MPDETAQMPVYKYINPHPADWPKADFIVGNPPFIGNKRMRFYLGDGYTDAIRTAYDEVVPRTADFVMYWWDKAAKLTQQDKLKSFGLITTNSITQVFNRTVIEEFISSKEPISLIFAIPDHPWVDSAYGAAVRIAMTVGIKGLQSGTVFNVTREETADDFSHNVVLESKVGSIFSNLTVGIDVNKTIKLKSNYKLASQGANPLGLGFRLSREEVENYGFSIEYLPETIRPYYIGKDLVQKPVEKYVIDFTDYSQDDAKISYPALYQHLINNVKPERDQNRRPTRRDNWWLFGENAPMFREGSNGLQQYITTCRTSKHRLFTMLPAVAIPDAKIVAIALDDFYFLGVLSSKTHLIWALKTGAWLGVGNDSNYNHSDCFGKFPFPNATPTQESDIRKIGEQLDAHRKRQQSLHDELTLTDMYNVLEKLRSGEAITAKEQDVHEKGLVSVLKQLHDDLDTAVLDAYGWPAAVNGEEILERLVALNVERTAEERQGKIRWLRPEFQNPHGTEQTQTVLEEKTVATEKGIKTKRPAWPSSLAAQAQVVRSALQEFDVPATPQMVARNFTRARVDRVTELLETLASLGQVRQLEDETFTIQ